MAAALTCVCAAGCGAASSSSSATTLRSPAARPEAAVATTAPPPTGNVAVSAPITVGFMMSGDRHDDGYNQAIFTASQAVAQNQTDVKVITADNVPESSATRTMQALVAAGAHAVFAASDTYYADALAFARANPNVTVLVQGATDPGTFPANFGTYGGATYESVFLGGMAAGAMTTTDKLGYVYASPSNDTTADVDAFELGAQSVNPGATTYLAATSSPCDPAQQQKAASALLSSGIDVLTQDQGCQATVIAAAKTAGKYVVGYNYDAESLDPAGWLTGSAWQWTPLYQTIIQRIAAGKFAGSEFNNNWFGTFAADDNPLQLTSYGSRLPQSIQAKINRESKALGLPATAVFAGPITCQNGSRLTDAGDTPTSAQNSHIGCLVHGVIGTIPTS